MTLHENVAVITGAARGIGYAIATRLAQEGAAVVITDRDAELAEQVASDLRASGYQAMALRLDVRERVEIEAMPGRVLEQFGRLDILVNNAGGGARHLGQDGVFHTADLDSIDWIVEVNLDGVLHTTRVVLDHMIERRSGRIINISSIAGVVGSLNAIAYSAAKGGVIAFTKSLAMELGEFGITVNAVSPGAVASIPGMQNAPTYVGRVGQPEEVAALVNFLCSEEASFITGHNHVIDGARSLGPLRHH